MTWLQLSNRRSNRARKHTRAERDEVLALYREGMPKTAIVKETGICLNSVHCIIKQDMDPAEIAAIVSKNRVRSGECFKGARKVETPTFEFRGGAAIAFCGKWST